MDGMGNDLDGHSTSLSIAHPAMRWALRSIIHRVDNPSRILRGFLRKNGKAWLEQTPWQRQQNNNDNNDNNNNNNSHQDDNEKKDNNVITYFSNNTSAPAFFGKELVATNQLGTKNTEPR